MAKSLDTVVLVSPRRKWLTLFAGSGVFVTIGVLMVATGDVRGWYGVVFFGLGVAVGLVYLVRPPQLTIDTEGMTSAQVGRRDRYEFRECSEFRTWKNPIARSQSLVVFDWDGAQRRRRLARLSKGMSGANSALPDTYGMTAEGLALLLNQRRRALRRLPR